MKRREFLKAAGVAAVGSLVGGCAKEAEEGFSFVHFTDPHIQPELRAAQGCAACFETINGLEVDFAIAGGDLVFDVLEVDRSRARMLFDLYRRTAADLKVPVHAVIGNHDVFGLRSGISQEDVWYGKKLYEDYLGARYYSFDHKGWHFIQLDSVGLTEQGWWRGEVDEEQLAWLESDLSGVALETPLVVSTHLPIFTAFIMYLEGSTAGNPDSVVVRNGLELYQLLSRHNLKAVLQGHTHIREVLEYSGCKFITSGAVSGNWWRGLRMGHPEGFGLLTVRRGEIHWEYRTYGWKAVVEEI